MVFSTTNLSKGIQCPQGEECALTNCIFAHDLRPKTSPALLAADLQLKGTRSATQDNTEPPTKRRRVTYDKAEDKPPSKADLIRSELAQSKTGAKAAPSTSGNLKLEPLPSLKRSVSPPAKENGKATLPAPSATNKQPVNNSNPSIQDVATQESIALNPRLVANDPAGHAKRSVYLKHLHAEMVRVNQQLVEWKDVQFKAGLTLRENELIELSLDEEEKLAREQGSVYGNVIKNRIATYRKMKPDDWIAHIKGTPLFAKKRAPPAKHPGALDPPKVIDTGLSAAEEAATLPHLVIKDQKPLAQFGYIPTPPTVEEAAEAAAVVEASKNYEVCDRCSARFQVYSQRNEEGLLTSNGKCRHHPNRKVFPQRTKADTGPKEPYYPCCNEAVGSAGCTATEHHVFKAGGPARLAAVMPFVVTPENDSPTRDRRGRSVKAVAFDCEMGYTTLGLELIRLTAVSWPEGEELADVLVRPLGIVLDLNSRFSGVWPEDMARAREARSKKAPPPPPQVDGSADSPPPPPPPLPMVESPYKARELLCSFITPSTPLIGHAIDNDLNVVRLCHPTIIDTVIVFPHPRGLPLRYGLKMLSSKHLGRAIQQGGERGHDSLEDSRATGDLVRVKVGEKWKLLRATGWAFVNGSLVPPSPPKEGEIEARRDSDSGLADRLVDKAMEGAAKGGRKRKKRGSGAGAEGARDGVDEEAQVGNRLKPFLERGKDAGAAEQELSVDYLKDDEKRGQYE